MALKSERSRIRFKDIESVSSYDAVHRTGLSAAFPEPPANEERGMSSLPQPVGEELRRARLQAGLEVSDVAAHLRIRSNFLSALEEGRPDALPGITYAIGYVRTYAGFLGLDPEAAVRRFKEEAAGLNSKTQLVFPSPAPEGRVPGLLLMLVAAMLAGGAFGGWYWLSERDGDLRGLVPAVPERLAQLIEGDAPSVAGPAGPAADASAAPAAGSYADANPAGVALPTAGTAPAASAPTAVAPTANTPTAGTPTASTPIAGTRTAAAPAAAGPAAPARALETSLPAGAPTRAPATTTPSLAPLAAAPAGAPPATAVPAASPAAPANSDGTVSAAAPTEPVPDGTPDMTAPPESTAANGGQAVPVAPAITPAARPAEVGYDVPAAPRIAGLIGASEAAVPAGRTVAGATDRVMIRATGDSWVQVRDSQGTALFTRVLREGDIYRVPEQSGLRLATGNAGALEILVDGSPVPSIGGFGEVVRNVILDPARLAAGTAAGAGR